MNFPWVLGIIVSLQSTQSIEVVEHGPPTGITLQETPRLLITHRHLYTQRIYICLDPWDVYCKHIWSPPQLTEGRLSGTQTQDIVEHAKLTTVHILEQLQKFLVTEDLSRNKWPKWFLGGFAILNNVLHALDAQSEVGRSDITYVQYGNGIQDLVRKTGASINRLCGGKIPAYLVPLDMVEQILSP